MLEPAVMRERSLAFAASSAVVPDEMQPWRRDQGSEPASMSTQARRDDDEWVLDGQKQWITSGGQAGVMVVWARTDEPGARCGHQGMSCFLVEQGTAGLEVGPKEDKLGLRASETVPLTFTDCRLPAEALLGGEGQGFRIAMMALDGGRIGIAWSLLRS